MPWEVGKLLLQVQWVPRHAGEPVEPEYVEEPDDAVGPLYPHIHHFDAKEILAE
jgi:hypothetical protein